MSLAIEQEKIPRGGSGVIARHVLADAKEKRGVLSGFNASLLYPAPDAWMNGGEVTIAREGSLDVSNDQPICTVHELFVQRLTANHEDGFIWPAIFAEKQGIFDRCRKEEVRVVRIAWRSCHDEADPSREDASDRLHRATSHAQNPVLCRLLEVLDVGGNPRPGKATILADDAMLIHGRDKGVSSHESLLSRER